MEKKLRRRIVLISTSVIFIVLTILAFGIYNYIYTQMDARTDTLIEVISANNGEMPKNKNLFSLGLDEEDPFSTRYFVVNLDSDNKYVSANIKNIAAIDLVEALLLCEKIIAEQQTVGYQNNLKYRVFESEKGKQIVFVDCKNYLDILSSFIKASVVICIFAFILVFALAVWLSKFATQPIVDAYAKQKQFITDVSHELKTPLAIIKANTQVSEFKNGITEWSESTNNQVARLNDLVNYLVRLTKIEEQNIEDSKIDLDLSRICYDLTSSFLTLAESKDKKLSYKIDNNVTFFCEEQSIKLLISVLLENAIKYGTPQKEIEFILKKNQKKKIIIEVINYAENLKKGDYSYLFQRFYRADTCRNSQENSFGIGLSLAQAVVKQHSGIIKATSFDAKKIVFKVEL